MTDRKKIEFIVSYVIDGCDYQYNDNHGTLIRCKDCKWRSYRNGNPRNLVCSAGRIPIDIELNDYCSRAEKREDNL